MNYTHSKGLQSSHFRIHWFLNSYEVKFRKDLSFPDWLSVIKQELLTICPAHICLKVCACGDNVIHGEAELLDPPPSAKWQNFSMLFRHTNPLCFNEAQDYGACNVAKFTKYNCVSFQLGTNWISALLIWQSHSGARLWLCAYVKAKGGHFWT